ncbi:MAG: hypothetical protein LBC83_00765 [Oscillospiraceae bacterium]|jgi:division/cell wall cluster transcriptional repressor MraZ|nr:hypothetical protein [Oscillospiraceae bacterium]
MAFQGTAEGTVDIKGRVCTPAKYRAGIEGQEHLMLWYSGDAAQPYLMLATQAEFDRVCRREYGRFEPALRAQVMRKLQVNSEPVELDKSCRFGLPERLAAKAGIRREERVFFIGFHTHIEIWQLDRWLAQGEEELSDTTIQLNFAPDPAWLGGMEEQPAAQAAPAEDAS